MKQNSWQVKSLGEVVRISKGKKLNSLVDTKTPTSKRFIQIDDLRNNEQLKYTEDNSGVLVNERDVLIAWDGANAGTVGFGLEGFIGSTIARLELLDEKISSNYLGWLLRAKSKYLRDNCTGATIPHINKSVLVSIKIPLPPLPIQKQIAEILEKADQAKQKRKESNKLTDEFLQSVFIEMFGDPVKNNFNWVKCRIAELAANFSDGPFGSNLKTEHYTRNGIRVIRLQNIGVHRFIDDDKVFVSELHYASLKKYSCFPGDVVIATLGDPNLRACILPKTIKLAINKADCILFRSNEKKCNSLYISALLNNPSTLLLASSMIHGQTRARINMGRLKDLSVPVPPLSLQQQFAEIVNKTEALKEKQKQLEQELENLFQSLMQKAFKGELVG